MNGPAKSRASLESLLRLRNSGRPAGEQLTLKNLIAQLRLEGRYDDMREQLGSAGFAPLTCVCKFDRVVATAPKLSWDGLVKLTDCRTVRQRHLWRKNYASVVQLIGEEGIRHINVEHEPTRPWLAPYRITIIPSDEAGLPVKDFRTFQELVPNCKLVLIEIALDFPIASIVDVGYVRAHFLSGKMKLRHDANPYHQRCGRGTHSRTIRAYVKWEAGVTRLELELHARFLRHHRIDDISDFQRLAAIVARRCILFAALDRSKITRRLQSMSVKNHQISAISAALDARKGDLWEALRYLREEVQLKNGRRFLKPLAEINQVVTEAIRTWAAQWPTEPRQLAGTKKK